MRWERIGIITALAIGSIMPFSVYAASGQGEITATLLDPLTITHQTPLDFGVVTGGEGTVILTPEGNRVATGSVTLDEGISAFPSDVSLSGTAGRYYQVQLPERLSIEGVEVTDLRGYSTVLGEEGERGQLNHSGHDTYSIGGTLHVPERTKAGRYKGVVRVTVSYE
jgi:hypothetical protein